MRYDDNIEMNITHALRRFALLASVCLLVPKVDAAFTEFYAVENFVLLNLNADGVVTTLNGGLTMNLKGGDNGSGGTGTTDFLISIPADGVVAFDYYYSACDSDAPTSCDLPAMDTASVLFDGIWMTLADSSGQFGIGVGVPVQRGQLFGFRVETRDNFGGAGTLTITNLEGPAPTPESSSASLMIVGFAWLLKNGWQRRRGAEVSRPEVDAGPK